VGTRTDTTSISSRLRDFAPNTRDINFFRNTEFDGSLIHCYFVFTLNINLIEAFLILGKKQQITKPTMVAKNFNIISPEEALFPPFQACPEFNETVVYSVVESRKKV